MSSLVLLAMILCVCVIWIVFVKRQQNIEHFNVLGGSMDIRYGTIGSTTTNASTLNAWIPVASWTNTSAWQNHALTVEIYPHNRNVGATRQTFAVLVRNNDKAQESDPIFVQQNIFDSLPDGTNTGPTFKSAALRYTSDPKNPLNNLYELFFQMGTGWCNNVSCAWVLSDFTTSDTVAVNNTDQIGNVTGGTKIYSPRLIGGDVTVTGNLFSNNVDINHHPPRAFLSSIDQTKSWDVAGGESATGAGPVLQIWDHYRGSGQLASYIPGTGQIIFAHSGRCLDLPNNTSTDGNQLRQWDCNGTPAQAWNMAGAGVIKHVQSGKCIDLNAGQTNNGNRIQLWTCANNNPNQKWY